MPRRLFMIRNAPAENAEAYALFDEGDDTERPLAPEGESMMQRVSPWLATQMGSVDVLATSPLLRARHSAEILGAALADGNSDGGSRPLLVMPELSPAEPAMGVLRALHRLKRADTVALVGHEASLNKIASWLISGTEKPILLLPEGGACLLAFEGDLQAGTGRLQWFLSPSLLEQLQPAVAEK